LHVKETVQYQPSDLVKARCTVPNKRTMASRTLQQRFRRLADDMGLGKTLQTLSTLVAVQEKLDFEKPKTSNSICLERNPVAKEYLKA
jgi:non-specific serine/threonine protein kinase